MGRHRGWTCVWLTTVAALAGASVWAQSPGGLSAPTSVAPTAETLRSPEDASTTLAPAATGTAAAPVIDTNGKAKLRQREGAKLTDRRGRFERRGDRYVFLSEESAVHYVVVENLMLERVANMLDDAAGGELLWNVSGVITEFRGSNFLMLQRAVVKASAGNSEPHRLDDPLAGNPPAAKKPR